MDQFNWGDQSDKYSDLHHWSKRGDNTIYRTTGYCCGELQWPHRFNVGSWALSAKISQSKSFDGVEAVRMVLDKFSKNVDAGATSNAGLLGNLALLSSDELRARSFTQQEIDAILDLMMEYFDIESFVADKVIEFLTTSPSQNSL